MKFEFINPNGIHRYEFHFHAQLPEYVDIITFEKGYTGQKAWMHKIKDGKVQWRNDNYLDLTEEAKEYLTKLVRLRAFW